MSLEHLRLALYFKLTMLLQRVPMHVPVLGLPFPRATIVLPATLASKHNYGSPLCSPFNISTLYFPQLSSVHGVVSITKSETPLKLGMGLCLLPLTVLQNAAYSQPVRAFQMPACSLLPSLTKQILRSTKNFTVKITSFVQE